MLFQSTSLAISILGFLCISTANGQWHHDGDNQSQPPWNYDNPGDNSASGGFGSGLASVADPKSLGGSILIAHAVIASAVWVLLIPLAGILLRLNIQSPWVLRAHATLQTVSYLLFIAAAGLGAWLADKVSSSGFAPDLWKDPHPVLGMVILGLAFVQPILGTVHHRLFKKRVAAAQESKSGPAPGRTVPGYMHLWLGRILIVLGMINGGLGIRLANHNPFQSTGSKRTAAYVYGFIAGAMFLLYLIFVVRFEINKAKRERRDANAHAVQRTVNGIPPTYAESQESVHKDHTGVTRYG